MSLRKVDRIYLISASPRRESLLRTFGIPLVPVPQDVDEIAGGTPEEATRTAAIRKMNAFLDHHEVEYTDRTVALSADTLVSVDGLPLRKPADEEEARSMLLHLSGRWHEVITSVCVHHFSSGKTLTSSELTLVRFAELDHDLIDRYLSTGEYADKAGGYAIQGVASAIIEGIEGDYFNVVGLPLRRVQRMLADLGLSLI
jgi:septum formation protein